MAFDFSKFKEKAKDFYSNKVQPTVKDVSKTVKNGVQAFMNEGERKSTHKSYKPVNFQTVSNENIQTETDSTPREQALAHSLTCPNCGGTFSIEDLTDGDAVVTCIHCRTTYSSDDIFQVNTSERIEKIRAQAYVSIENRKIEAKKETAIAKSKDKEERNLDKLERLKELLDTGVITEKEYNQKKKILLRRFNKKKNYRFF